MVSIPTGVWTAYEEFADEMIAEFGETCVLSYSHKVETTSHTTSRYQQKRTMNIRDRSSPDAFGRGSTSYKEVTTTENISLRVYWTKRDWRKIGEWTLPDGAIVCIGYLSDIKKIQRSESMQVQVAEDDANFDFRLINEPFPWGFKKRRYLVSFWERI